MTRRTTLNLLIIFLVSPLLFAQRTKSRSLEFQSPFLKVEFAATRPGMVYLAVDSLGKGKLRVNTLRSGAQSESRLAAEREAGKVEYRRTGAPPGQAPEWSLEVSGREIRLHSVYGGKLPAAPLVLDFDLDACHATLLGLMNEDASVRLPALLHLPDQGTLRITSPSAPQPYLGYQVIRFGPPKHTRKFVRVIFPGASESRPRADYTLEVTAIYPDLPGLQADPRFDGFRRNFLNIFQQSPRFRTLANNSASDACAITVYEFGEVALRTPPLAPGLTALDLVRQTIDRYLAGMKGCGMKGYNTGTPDVTGFDFLDAYPSLVIAGADYALGSRDRAWLDKNYAGLRDWAGRMLAFDTDGDGLLEYPQTRASGPWPWNHPANWWDAIWFTHKDAFSNALAYQALLRMAQVAKLAGHDADAAEYSAHAAKLLAAYTPAFYDAQTGVLAGWKDAGGKLHDYYFTFVNSMAIAEGLVPAPLAQRIMDRLFAKMKEVGYSQFSYGLPGNLIPIRKEDYNSVGIEWGGPQKEDGSDAFQNYENGGASACFVYYMIEALYKLGRWQQGDGILFPMLKAFDQGGFQGRGPNGRTYDWKRWDGTPKGYEGLLADGYMTLLAVITRQAHYAPGR